MFFYFKKYVCWCVNFKYLSKFVWCQSIDCHVLIDWSLFVSHFLIHSNFFQSIALSLQSIGSLFYFLFFFNSYHQPIDCIPSINRLVLLIFSIFSPCQSIGPWVSTDWSLNFFILFVQHVHDFSPFIFSLYSFTCACCNSTDTLYLISFNYFCHLLLFLLFLLFFFGYYYKSSYFQVNEYLLGLVSSLYFTLIYYSLPFISLVQSPWFFTLPSLLHFITLFIKPHISTRSFHHCYTNYFKA